MIVRQRNKDITNSKALLKAFVYGVFGLDVAIPSYNYDCSKGALTQDNFEEADKP